MRKNSCPFLIAVSALRYTAVQTRRRYVSGTQIPVNSIELGARTPGAQPAGDTAKYLLIINTPATRSYHRQSTC